MAPTIEQRVTRLNSRLGELRTWSDSAYQDLQGWTLDGQPVELGTAWHSDGVVTFALAHVEVPTDWPLDDARLNLDLGGEGLVCIRYPSGAEEAFGLDPRHQRFPLRERSFSIEANVVARLPFGQPVRDAHLALARLVLADRVVERFVRQVYLVTELAAAMPGHDVVVPLVSMAEKALASIDWPSDTWTYLSRIRDSSTMTGIWRAPEGLDPHPPGLTVAERESVRSASEKLRKAIETLRDTYPHEGRIALVGHAHLDLAWLWPLEETRRKARRTWNTAIALMDRYPEFVFNQSTAQLYAFVEEDDPELFEKVRERVAAGQWEPVGGMWVEPDINMPAGESLVRQLLYGQRYFQRHFGSIHTVCWLPDCFGFNPTLPQLLRGAGIDSFFTIKLTWSETNQFPYDLFWWEGLDGSRVLAHMFNNPDHAITDTSGYNGDPGPSSLVTVWRNFRGKAQHPESLLSIGYGDGGGGVTFEMLEQAREVPSLPAIPVARFRHVHEFYADLHESVAAKGIPLWLGEMYLELHRGTLTTQSRTKYLHRRAERDLVAAEVLASMSHLLDRPEPESLEEQWRLVLRNEFHDILPGSSIREVYQTAESELESVEAAAAERMRAELRHLAERLAPGGDRPAILLVNPDLSARPVRVQVDAEIEGAQPVDDGYVVAPAGSIPPLGVLVLTDTSPAGTLTVSEERLENDFLRVSILPDGTLGRVYDKRADRQAIEGRANQIWAYVDKPPHWQAWDLDIGYADQGEEVDDVASITVVERGPHRVAVRVIKRFRGSTITQDIRLWANSPRLEFATEIDWHDRRWLLKARFPLAIRSSHATFETAFGVVERPTHRNTSWEWARFEVAGHRFADLSEPAYGVALLNDGKYGHHVIGHELGLSLLRSPIHPDPLADEGRQRFTYALYPHTGSWLEGGVLAEAEDLNRPLLATPVTADAPSSWQPLSVEGPSLGLGALKVAEDGGGLILRVYEPAGARGEANITLPDGWKIASEVDLLERDIGSPEYVISPFQVRSWLLKRGQ